MRHGTIGEVIQESVRRCKRKSTEQIADELGVGYSNFSRQLNPNDEGARFPAEYLIPLMRATGDYSALQHMAARTGHVVVSVKKLRVPKGSTDNDIREALQETFLDMTKKLGQFFRDPTPALKEETMQALDAHLGEALAARKKVDKWHQPELELE